MKMQYDLLVEVRKEEFLDDLILIKTLKLDHLPSKYLIPLNFLRIFYHYYYYYYL